MIWTSPYSIARRRCRKNLMPDVVSEGTNYFTPSGIILLAVEHQAVSNNSELVGDLLAISSREVICDLASDFSRFRFFLEVLEGVSKFFFVSEKAASELRTSDRDVDLDAHLSSSSLL